MEIVGKEFKKYQEICQKEMDQHVDAEPFKVIGSWEDWLRWSWMKSGNQVFGLRFKQTLWFELKKYEDKE